MAEAFGIIAAGMFIVSAVMAPISGGYQANKDRKALCDKISETKNNIKDLIANSKKIMQNLCSIDANLLQQTTAINRKIADNQQELKILQNKFKKMYVQLQILLIIIFIMIGGALYLKHTGMLTLHPTG